MRLADVSTDVRQSCWLCAAARGTACSQVTLMHNGRQQTTQRAMGRHLLSIASSKTAIQNTPDYYPLPKLADPRWRVRGHHRATRAERRTMHDEHWWIVQRDTGRHYVSVASLKRRFKRCDTIAFPAKVGRFQTPWEGPPSRDVYSVWGRTVGVDPVLCMLCRCCHGDTTTN